MTTTLMATVKNLVSSYNSTRHNVPGKLGQENPLLVNYALESQLAEIQKAKDAVARDFLARVKTLKAETENERKRIPLEIGKIKTPNLLSKDSAERSIGESQVNSALLFLTTPHSAEATASVIKNALVLGRREFAFTLIENIRLSIPKEFGQDKPSQDQKELLASIAGLEDAFSDKAKLDELEGESQALAKVETMVGDFEAQLTANREAVILPELFPALTEQERLEMMARFEALGENLTPIERVQIKTRIAEAMSLVPRSAT